MTVTTGMSLAPVSAVCVPTTSALSVGSIMATTALDASGMARATAIPVPHAGDAHATVSSGPQTLPTDHAPMTTLMPAAPGSPSPVLTPGALPAPANMLPQIPLYHGGEQKDRETFQDWLEHFEAVSQLARWDDHYKLVYLTTALQGSAKAFYQSCSPTQRSSYHSLVAELKKRFIPVQLTAVQTQLFHDR